MHPDIYRLGKVNRETEALRALAQAGYDTTQIDRDVLKNAARRSRSGAVGVAIANMAASRGLLMAVFQPESLQQIITRAPCHIRHSE